MVRFPDVFSKQDIERVAELIEEASGLYLLIRREESLGSITLGMSPAAFVGGLHRLVGRHPIILSVLNSLNESENDLDESEDVGGLDCESDNR